MNKPTKADVAAAKEIDAVIYHDEGQHVGTDWIEEIIARHMAPERGVLRELAEKLCYTGYDDAKCACLPCRARKLMEEA